MPAKPRVLTKKEDLFKWWYGSRDVYIFGVFIVFAVILLLVFWMAIEFVSIPYFILLILYIIVMFYTFKWLKYQKSVNYYDLIMWTLSNWGWISKSYYQRLIFRNWETLELLLKKEYIHLDEIRKMKDNHLDILGCLVSSGVITPTAKENMFKVNIHDPKTIKDKIQNRIVGRDDWDKRYGVRANVLGKAVLVLILVVLLLLIVLKFRA